MRRGQDAFLQSGPVEAQNGVGPAEEVLPPRGREKRRVVVGRLLEHAVELAGHAVAESVVDVVERVHVVVDDLLPCSGEHFAVALGLPGVRLFRHRPVLISPSGVTSSYSMLSRNRWLVTLLKSLTEWTMAISR